MNEEEIEKTVRKINGTMTLEGMPLDDFDKELTRKILKGELSPEDAIKIAGEHYGF